MAAHKSLTTRSLTDGGLGWGQKSEMKFSMFFLLLLSFAAVAATAPVRAQRQNVLTFLNDALGTTTEKTTSAKSTVLRNPQRPLKEQNSDDLSEEKSIEIFTTDGFPGYERNEGGSRDASDDLDSYEIVVPFSVAKEPAPSRRTTGGKGNMQRMDVSNGPFQHQRSQKQSRTRGQPQASREKTDRDSEGGMMAGADSWTQSTSLQRQATAAGVKGMNERLVSDRSKETPDWDSFEDNGGRLAAMGNNKHADYDETREYISSESNPFEPDSLSVPAKSRAA